MLKLSTGKVMGKSRWLWLGLSLFLSISQTLYAGNTVGGAGDAGGGNGIRSTPEQVKSELVNIKEKVKVLVEANYWKQDEFKLNKNSALSNLIEKMSGKRRSDFFWFDEEEEPILAAIENSKIVDTGKCTDARESDASSSFNPGSDICFNVRRLTRVNPIALEHELAALFMHEIAHQFGASEDEAQAFQSIIFARSKLLHMWWITESLKKYTEKLKFSEGNLADLGELTALANSEYLLAGRSMSIACIENDKNMEEKLLKYQTWINSYNFRGKGIKETKSLEELSLTYDVPVGLRFLTRDNIYSKAAPFKFDDRLRIDFLFAYVKCIQYNVRSVIGSADTTSSVQTDSNDVANGEYDSSVGAQ